MRIIISPAKKMVEAPDLLPMASLPQFLSETKTLLEWMQNLTYAEAKTLWKCSDRLTEFNLERLRHMNLYRNLTPALVSYEGIQFQYTKIDVTDLHVPPETEKID